MTTTTKIQMFAKRPHGWLNRIAAWLVGCAGLAVVVAGPSIVVAQSVAVGATDAWGDGAVNASRVSDQPVFESASGLLNQWSGPAGVGSAWKTMIALSVLSLAPAILLMTTSFVRISVVLALLRQAIGTQMLPSNQVITSLALFMTVLIMSPIWKQVYRDSITPYSASEISAVQAWDRGIAPVRTFMSQQIQRAGNGADVYLFYDHLVAGGEQETAAPQTYDEVPIEALLPAFVLSELKTAFLIGFQVFLPFLVIDLVVASITTSMGMMMLPPVMVSLPMKLLLFVLVDGWHLVVGMLLHSFGPLG
jgi:flagellar biosynthetic protein FliP